MFFCCTIMPFTNKKVSIKELDFGRSVCMAAICYSNPIRTISSEFTLLPYTISHAKFFVDILSNEKGFHTNIWSRSFSLYGSYML